MSQTTRAEITEWVMDDYRARTQRLLDAIEAWTDALHGKTMLEANEAREAVRAELEAINRLEAQHAGAVDALYEIATQPFADGTTPRQKARSALLAMGLDWRTTTGGR